MYCTVKYSVPVEPNVDEEKFASGLSILHSTTTVFDNKELLINPNCYVQILIDYLYSEIGIDKNVDFDLCDEMGQLQKLKTLKPYQSATDVLKFEELYYIVLCERGENGQYCKLEPLLNKNSKQFSELNMKLRRNTSGVKKSSFISPRKPRRSSDKTSTLSFASTRKRPVRNKSSNT